jgi:hypothetical protein
MADIGATKTAQRTGYLFRHQAAGILTSHVFLTKPTDAQLRSMRAECERLHGAAHPKTGEAYWTSLVEVPLMDVGDVPAFPPRERPSGRTANIAGAVAPQVSGSGTVTLPEGSSQ